MGNCCLDAQTRQINRRMRQGENNDDEIIKLLFLGAGGSGKSTLFKQLRLLHGNGLGEEERLGYRSNIYRNLVDGMKKLLEGNFMLMDEENDETVDAKTAMVSCDEKLAEYIEELDDGALITKETAEYFQKAWSDSGMQATWKQRSVLQLQDSLKYFIGHIARIAEDNYVPTVDDVMHVRVQTTGIVEEHLTMNDRSFLIVDVGGQRSERRKWINCFSGVTGLIFVASLTAYNQFLYEDESVNRLKESLGLFKSLVNAETFKEAAIVLFLNKSDLFSVMCKETPITISTDYNGNGMEEDQYNFIKTLYENQADKHRIYTHKTCATQTDQIKHIFDSVNHNVINRALIEAGLLPPQ